MYVVVKISFFYVGFHAPYAGEKKVSGKNLTGISEKYFQKGTFAAGKSAFFCTLGKASAFRIKKQYLPASEDLSHPIFRDGA